MWLLQWLVGVASRVLEWFGSLWHLGKTVILNVGYWLYQWANTAYTWARNWAYPLIQSARNHATFLYYDIRYWAQRWRDEAVQVARNFTQWVHDQAIFLYYDLRYWAQRWRDEAVSFARSFAQNLFDQAVFLYWEIRYQVQSTRDLILEIYDSVKNIISIFTPLVIGRLLDLLNNSFSQLTGFVQNPVGHIAAIIRPFLLELLAFLVAYALGTEKAELPPMPNFGAAGGAIPDYPTTPPPDVRDGLVSPLSRLSISGYRFNPNHPAIDLGLSKGDPVFAMHAGTIIVAGWSKTGYGNHVVLQGGDWWTLYAHLDSFGVQAGQQIQAGQIVGLGDSTGNSTGDHLHLEIKYKGKFIDPVSVLF